LNNHLAEYIANQWAGAVGLTPILTTGTARDFEGATTRKRLVKANILAAASLLNRQDVPMAGRHALISADQLEDLMLIEEFANSDYNSRKALAEGSQESFYFMGFQWHVRSKAVLFDSGLTLKAPGASVVPTDFMAAMFWHKDFVRRAEGGVQAFANVNDPEYYGDVVSALVRVGAKEARNDGKGIALIVEAAGA
jgi:hypothetical protein